MSKLKHQFHDGRGRIYDHPVDPTTGKPLTSSVSKRKPTSIPEAPDKKNPYR